MLVLCLALYNTRRSSASSHFWNNFGGQIKWHWGLTWGLDSDSEWFDVDLWLLIWFWKGSPDKMPKDSHLPTSTKRKAQKNKIKIWFNYIIITFSKLKVIALGIFHIFAVAWLSTIHQNIHSKTVRGEGSVSRVVNYVSCPLANGSSF